MATSKLIRRQDKSQRPIFWGLIIIFSLSRLYLFNWQTLITGGSLHDDQLFLALAENISNGNWLGEYNNRTLIKGPFYPIWIAINAKLGMPLLLSQHLLYILSCVLFIYAVSLRLKNSGLLITIFIIILFNPMSYSDGIIAQVMRSAIYPSLAVLIVSAAILQIFLFRERKKINIFLSFISGIFLSVFWLTREESIWIFPYLGIYYCFMLIKLSKVSHSLTFISKQAFFLLIPLIILLLSITAIAALNKHHYQVFQYNELKSSYFKSAYGALIRVKHIDPQAAIPVPEETRNRIYQASPAFRELQPFLEGNIGKKWGSMLYNLKQVYLKGRLNKPLKKAVDALLKNDISGTWRHLWKNAKQGEKNINGSVFIWAFRDSVAAAGYRSGTDGRSFYLRLADEINQACDMEKLDCLSQRESLTPSWRMEYLGPLIKTFTGSILFLVDHYEFSSNIKSANNKIFILHTISFFYQHFMSWVLGGLSLLYLAATVRYFKQLYLNDYWIISSALLVAVCFFLLGLSYVHVSSFPTIAFRYFAPIYPLLIIYIVFVCLTLNSLSVKLQNSRHLC